MDDDQPVLYGVPFRLSYGDCDPAGIVYDAAYYRWFERGSYLVPGRLHDPLTVRMRLVRVGTTSFTLAFSVDHAETEVAFARGTMTMVFVDLPDVDRDERPRPVPVPDALRVVLRDAGYRV